MAEQHGGKAGGSRRGHGGPRTLLHRDSSHETDPQAAARFEERLQGLLLSGILGLAVRPVHHQAVDGRALQEIQGGGLSPCL